MFSSLGKEVSGAFSIVFKLSKSVITVSFVSIGLSLSGNVSLSGDSAHLAMLQAGTKIIPSDETKRIMQAAAMSKRSTVEQTIEKGNRDIVKAIRDKESLIINAATGNSITKRQGNVWKTYFDKHLS